MLVVIGIPVGVTGGDPLGVAGTPALAAVAAARAGASVELVGKVGDDDAGDAAVLALGRLAVGHAAVLRDPGHHTPVQVASPVEDTEAVVADLETDAGGAVATVDRTGWPTLEAEDLQLALRYLPDVRAIVVAEQLPDRVMTAVTDAASYLAAPVVVVQAHETPAAGDVVLAAPDADPDGAFADVLGQLGAALDRGVPVDEAFAEISGKLGLTPTSA